MDNISTHLEFRRLKKIVFGICRIEMTCVHFNVSDYLTELKSFGLGLIGSPNPPA